MSPLTVDKGRPNNNSPVRNQLLHCNYLPFLTTFNILAEENQKFLLIKESFPIIGDKPLLNRSIRSAHLFLFHKIT